MRAYAMLGCSFLLVALAFGQSYQPKEGYVPDSATAVKIAEAVLVPVYGQKLIESERPFTSELKADVWTVSGTLHCPDGKGGFKSGYSCRGGAATVQISKTDAHVVSMTHGK